MSERPLVFLDLDRTLFDTRRAPELWQVLAKHYDIDAEACSAERSRWYVWTDKTTYYHDFSAQLRNYNIDVAAAYEYLRHSPIGKGALEFPYVDVLVQTLVSLADVKVLTFGADDYQRVKAMLCPSLADIEIITTTESKRRILEQYGHGRVCWVVDDRPIGHDLPEGVQFVQVALESEVPDFTEDWPIFTSLKDVKEYLYEKLH